MHGGFGCGVKKERRLEYFRFATSYDLVTANTCFKKRDEYLITCKSGFNFIQTDFLLTRRVDQVLCENNKYISRKLDHAT